MTLEAQIKCVRREISMRERVYPSFIARGKIRPTEAENEIATMRAVLKTLEGLLADSKQERLFECRSTIKTSVDSGN